MRSKAVSIAVVLSLVLSLIAVAAPLWQVVQASCTEVSYDDGEFTRFAETACPSCSNFAAVRFSLPEGIPSASITAVRFYYQANGETDIHITGTDTIQDLMAPIKYSVSAQGWQSVDISGVSVDGDFYVMLRQRVGSAGSDYWADGGRSYIAENPGSMQPWDRGDIMIRATLGDDSTPPTTPVVVDDGDYTDNGTQLHATWSSSDNESGIAEYLYAIGTSAGGTDVIGWASAGTATEVTRTHLSLIPDTTYYFAVRAKNSSCLMSQVGKSDGITFHSVPETDFSADKTMAVVGQSIQFSDKSTGIAPSWQWDFGDGATSTLQNPSHSYSSIGSYSVSFTATNSAGAQTETKTSYITICQSPQADFLASSLKSSEGRIIVFFTNLSSGGVPPLTYAWDFENDGTIDSIEREPWHSYDISGTYTVRLVITDTMGNTDTMVKTNCLTILSSQGASVQTADGQIATEFPSGAVAGTAMVTIEQMPTSPLPEVPEGFKVGNTCFIIKALDDSGSEIVTLSQPISITVKYSDQDVAAAGNDPNNLVLAYWDEAKGGWVTLPTTVDTAEMTLTTATSHLSTWAVLSQSPSEGLAAWIWIAIGAGAAAVAGAGILTYFLRRRPRAHN